MENKLNNNFVEGIISGDDFSSEKKAMGYLQIQNRKDELNDLKKTMIEQQKKLLNDDGASILLDEKIKDLTSEDIRRLTDEEIENIYTKDDNTNIKLAFNSVKKEVEFKRDFLLYKKLCMESFKEIDETIEKFDKEIQKDIEEFNETIKKYGDLNKFIRSHLEDKIKNCSEENKSKYEEMLKNFDNGFNLNNIIDFCRSISPKKILNEYKYKSDLIFEQFMKTVKKLNFSNFNITNVHENIESKFLPEEYNKYPNLFIFCIFKYIAYKRFDPQQSKEGIFLSQLNLNLKKLTTNKFTEEEKNEFLNNIKKVLDLFL